MDENELENKLLSFNPAECKLTAVDNFKQIIDSLSEADIKKLGDKFTVWKLGYKIVEIPIIFTDRTEGTSKMSKGIFREAIFGVLNLKIRSWFRHYKRLK